MEVAGLEGEPRNIPFDLSFWECRSGRRDHRMLFQTPPPVSALRVPPSSPLACSPALDAAPRILLSAPGHDNYCSIHREFANSSPASSAIHAFDLPSSQKSFNSDLKELIQGLRSEKDSDSGHPDRLLSFRIKFTIARLLVQVIYRD
ncbi:hypothetical protein KQX54_015367 [Cotesia glomerata]|uniref:Uncharacterized protein n=1 Tax=Cotesia glomerata TaxID=32391 RepID=A0AAV7IV99_COTGL|nr:hypothetical protein KQX54_015367 [Cotesia glomerata]